MSTTTRGRAGTGATSADCVRLWRTLTEEYIPSLRLEIQIQDLGDDVGVLSVEVVDDSAVPVDGEALVNVWATRTFRSELYLISVDQLFGLLIDAHKVIDRYFQHGQAFAPTRRSR